METERSTTTAATPPPPDQAARGERAFKNWIDDHRSRMLAVAARYAHEAVGAEDIVQEASLIAYERRHTLRDPEAAGTWLVGIVRNVGRQEARKHARQTGLLNGYGKKLAADVSPQTEDGILTKVQVRRAIDELPDIQRQVVICRYFREMSHKEIAASLGRAEGTVRSDLCRAHRALQEILG